MPRKDEVRSKGGRIFSLNANPRWIIAFKRVILVKLNNGKTMELRQIFLKFFDKATFLNARDQSYSAKHPYYKLFDKEIPSSLLLIVDGFQSKSTSLAQTIYKEQNKYSFAASIGNGVLADIFWFAIMDDKITNDPQRGVYVVYLVSYDGESIYLCLMQAVKGAIKSAAQCEDAIRGLKGAREGLMKKIEARLEKIPEKYAEGFAKGTIDLSLNDEKNFFTAKAYQEAVLYSKKYNCDSVPSEEELRKDLWKMMKIYGNYRTSLMREIQR